jgi:phosphoinositide-3-kinase, regulatory subunit 4
MACRTRPFLADIEKQWILFQLLVALSQTQLYGFFHGDIKSENVMVTSSNWVLLTDFAVYKPTYISSVWLWQRLCQ